MGATAGQVSFRTTVHRGVLGYGPRCERPVQGILAGRLVPFHGRWAGSAGWNTQIGKAVVIVWTLPVPKSRQVPISHDSRERLHGCSRFGGVAEPRPS